MKIYSWNIWYRSQHLDRAFDFISESDFDVWCLQEVPEVFLARLKTLPYQLFYMPEVDRIVKGKRVSHYVVIISKFPIRHTGMIPLPYWEPNVPLRTRMTVSILVALAFWSWGKGNRHGIYADVETPSGITRVFNLHLVLMSPKQREQEFVMAMEHLDPTLPTIVCGDFNIIESMVTSMTNWILGGRISDMFMVKRERKNIEKHFANRELTNAHRGRITHRISRSQLDHILVSKHLKTVRAEVLSDPVGSDHRPIFVEVQ